jgi:type I restriction enzyme, S subunit
MTKNISNNSRELPKGWEWKTVGEVCDKIQTGTTPSMQIDKYYINPTFNWYSPSDFNDSKVLKDANKKLSNIAVEEGKARIYDENTLLLIAIGGTIGKVAISREKSSSNQQITGIKFKQNVNVDFSYYWFITIKNEIINQASASTLPIINQSGIKNLPFILPPLKEQERIVQKLDTAFQSLDEAITLQKENIAHTQELKKAVLEECYLGLYENFKKVKINEITSSFNGYAFDSKSFNDAGIGRQVVRIGNVMDLNKNPVYINADDKFDKWLLKEGDIIMSLTGTRGKKDYLFASIIEKPNLYLNQRVACFRMNNSALNSYLYYYFWSSLFRDTIFESETGAVNQGNMSLNNILNFQIPLPPLSEQEKNVAYLDTSFAKLDALIMEQEERLEQLMELKKSILQEAFEGKL